MTSLITPAIEIVVKSSVILGLTFLATLAVRRQSAALRHTIWTVGLLCALALPLFSLALPAWYLEPIRVVQNSAHVSAPQPVAADAVPLAVSATAAVPSAPSSITPERMLLVLWLMGILAVASLLLREAVRLARVAFGSIAVHQSSWREIASEVSNALRLKRHVRLMRNPNASVLGTWGTLRPRVLLPRESESWSSERMRVVLGHELAHVKRNDWLVQVFAETARALYWFNPLFWIACSQLRRESEHACDDAAIRLGVRLGIDGPTYASHVLDLARTLKHSGQPAAALAMASTSNLERRLIAMLNPSLNRRVTGRGTAVIVMFVALGLTLPLAAMQPQSPLPAVSEIRPIESAPRIQAAMVSPVAATAPIVQRPAPKIAAAIAPTSSALYVVPIQPAAAQNATGSFSGTVSDQSGALIPGVVVNLTAQSSGLVRQTLSNESGAFAFSQLTPDSYSATASLPGFQQSKMLYALSDPGSSVRVRFTLTIAPFYTAVEIATQAPPGLRCFSVVGAFKSDGTPFTEADCPGGTIVTGLPPKGSVQMPVEPIATNGILVVDSSQATGVQPVAPATGRPYPIRVGGDLQAASLLFHPSPVYPAEARSAGIQGFVALAGIVGKDGRLQSLKVIGSSNPALETTVLETIQNWIYKPALLNREPVEVVATITLNFTLGR